MSRDSLNESSEGTVLIGDLMGDCDNRNDDGETLIDADADGTVVNYAEEEIKIEGGEEDDDVEEDVEEDDEEEGEEPAVVVTDSDTQTDPSPIDPELQRKLLQLHNDNSNLAVEFGSMRNRNEFLTTANNELTVTTRRMEEEWKAMNMERVEKDGMVRKLQAVAEAMKEELDVVASSNARVRQDGGEDFESKIKEMRGQLKGQVEEMADKLNMTVDRVIYEKMIALPESVGMFQVVVF